MELSKKVLNFLHKNWFPMFGGITGGVAAYMGFRITNLEFWLIFAVMMIPYTIQACITKHHNTKLWLEAETHMTIMVNILRRLQEKPELTSLAHKTATSTLKLTRAIKQHMESSK